MAYFKRDELVKLAIHMEIETYTKGEVIKQAIMDKVISTIEATIQPTEEPHIIIVF